REHRRGAEHGPGARRGTRAVFLFDLFLADAPEVAVGALDLVGEAGVIAVEGIDDRQVALAYAVDAFHQRVTLGRQACNARDALLVGREVALDGLRREFAGKPQFGDAPDLAQVGGRERNPRGEHVVGDLRVDVLERISRLQRGVGLVRAEVRSEERRVGKEWRGTRWR